MRYKVVLSKNEDGYTVHCPGLRGCWSQGATEAEALVNIRSAIEEYLAAVDDLTARQSFSRRACPARLRSSILIPANAPGKPGG